MLGLIKSDYAAIENVYRHESIACKPYKSMYRSKIWALDLINKVWELYGIGDKPKLLLHEDLPCAGRHTISGFSQIQIRTNHENLVRVYVLIHELTHSILEMHRPENLVAIRDLYNGHCPYFVKINMEMHNTFGFTSLQDWERADKRMGDKKPKRAKWLELANMNRVELPTPAEIAMGWMDITEN